MRDTTKLVAEGRDPERYFGVVNLPVFRASTILYPDVEAFEAPRQVRGVYYGRGARRPRSRWRTRSPPWRALMAPCSPAPARRRLPRR